MFDPLKNIVHFRFLYIHYPYIKHGGNDVISSHEASVTKMPQLSDITVCLIQ